MTEHLRPSDTTDDLVSLALAVAAGHGASGAHAAPPSAAAPQDGFADPTPAASASPAATGVMAVVDAVADIPGAVVDAVAGIPGAVADAVAPIPGAVADAARRIPNELAQSMREFNQGIYKPDAPIPIIVKLFGILGIVSGVMGMVVTLLLAIAGITVFAAGENYTTTTIVLAITYVVLGLTAGIMYVVLGVRLLIDRRRHAAELCWALAFVEASYLVVTIMLAGANGTLISNAIQIALLIFLHSFLDPTLLQERQLRRKLRKLNEESAEEARIERLNRFQGKAPFHLTYFNLFWTFVVCCFLGLVIEQVYCFIVSGATANRAGLLYGPFSPIYGFGAVLMTLALNGIRDKNPVLIFLAAALIGGVFEFLVSWFFEFAFGILTWDYSGTFLNIQGRTNLFYMCCWGLLGLLWIKLLLPALFKLVYAIPWNWRYIVTGVATVLMIIDGAMTLMAFDCWFSRSSDVQYQTEPAAVEFFDTRYGDEWMESRFQTMTMATDHAARVDLHDLLPEWMRRAATGAVDALTGADAKS